MLNIHCPQCDKSFLWTDEMPVQGPCPTEECSWRYNIHAALHQNIVQREDKPLARGRRCSYCETEISSPLTMCPACGRVVFWNRSIRKIHFFAAVCVALLLLSIIMKYQVK